MRAALAPAHAHQDEEEEDSQEHQTNEHPLWKGAQRNRGWGARRRGGHTPCLAPVRGAGSPDGPGFSKLRGNSEGEAQTLQGWGGTGRREEGYLGRAELTMTSTSDGGGGASGPPPGKKVHRSNCSVGTSMGWEQTDSRLGRGGGSLAELRSGGVCEHVPFVAKLFLSTKI